MALPPPTPRVLHVITHFALGGAERIALELARGTAPEFAAAILAIHGRSGDDIGQAMWQEARDAGIPIFTGTSLALKRGGVLPAARRIRQAVTSFAPDVVHLHTEIPEFAFAVSSVAPRLPLVRTVHNSQYWHHWSALGRWTDRRLARAWVTAVSSSAGESFATLRRASGAPPPPATPRIIFNAVAPPRIPAELPRPARPGAIRVLFAGRFETQKGVDLLPAIAAATRLPPGATVELVLHGNGGKADLLRDFAARPPAGWTISVQPPVAGLADQLYRYDALLMPSRFEGFSLIAIEAMLAGVPLVATDAPGLREQLPPGHPWRAAAGDAEAFAAVLTRVLQDHDLRRRSALIARDFARATFSFEAMLAGYAALYRDIRYC